MLDSPPDAELDYHHRQSAYHWDQTLRSNPIGQLLLADALLERYEIYGVPHSEFKINQLKLTVGELLRTIDPALVLGGLYRTQIGAQDVQRCRLTAPRDAR